MNDRRRDGSSASAPPNPPSPLPAPPVGQENWLDFIEQQARKAHDLRSRGHIIDLYKSATAAERGSLSIWLAYCEYFWSLYYSSHNPGQHRLARPWPPDELGRARTIFSLDSALHLWQEAHDATRYRLSDSHKLWNRWIAKEMELLSQSRTQIGIQRITHLFRNRLMIPHAAWAETSSAFSRFLSENNRDAWEETMRDVSSLSQQARDIYDKRDGYELRIRNAAVHGDRVAEAEAMKDYLQFEIKSTIREKKNPRTAILLSLGLFSRALTGLLANDEATWADYVVFISTLYHRFSSAETRDPDMLQIIPSSFSVLQVAVQHCAWSGQLWARYILSGEEAGLSFSAMERIKHAATDSSQLERNGMVPVIDMYAAWCGYLKRSAMDPAATEEMIDVADSGLLAALEAVEVTGRRLFGNAYLGDPDFRLERILIAYLTEKHAAIEDARHRWLIMADTPLYASSYNFWIHFYVWELSVYKAEKGKRHSPTPGNATPFPRQRPPSQATEVLQRALKRKDLDWPERIMEVYMQHCTDQESPETLRLAYDFIHRTRKLVEQRRRDEAAAHAAAQAAQAAPPQPAAQTQEAPREEPRQAPRHTPQEATDVPDGPDARHDSPSGSKRKRGDSLEESEGASKRAKNDQDTAHSVDASANSGSDGSSSQQPRPATEPDLHHSELKRDREHTSVIITNLPLDTTQTKVRQYFREYGHVNSIVFKRVDEGQSAIALIEFRTPEEATSALLRDGKYYDKAVISVRPGTGLTLWVTNFPPTADEGYVRRLFKDCGEVFDIRWPSLKANTHRRFCYVAFREQDAARKAVALDGTLLEGKYKLQAKISDPTQRKAREGATSEGREVKVRNLALDADEGAVREMFGRYGKVQAVRLLRGMGGKPLGTGFVVFETKDEAEKSVAELNGAKLRNSILAVEVAKASNFKPVARNTAGSASMSPSPAPSGPAGDGEGDIAMQDQGQGGGGGSGSGSGSSPSREPPSLRTFALLGIPDTVNDTRVRALVDKHCGGGDSGSSSPVVKLVLRPDHGGAIVEMVDQATAGKAQLALEGAEIDGRAIRTGSVAELLGEKAEVRTDRIDLPKPKSTTTASSSASSSSKVPKPATMGPASSGGGGSGGGGVKMLPPSRINIPSGLGKKLPKQRGPGFPKPVVAPAAAAAAGGGPSSSTASAANGTAPAPAVAAPAPKSNSQFRDMFLNTTSASAASSEKERDEGSGDKEKEAAAPAPQDEIQNGK